MGAAEKGGGLWIPFGYLFSLLGGLLGVGIGGMLWRTKVKDASGQKVFKYTAGTRRHGLVILIIGGVMFGLWSQIADRLGEIGVSSPSSSSTPAATQPSTQPATQPSTSTPAQSQPARETQQSRPQSSEGPMATATNEYEELVLSYLQTVYENNIQGEGFGPAFQSYLGSLSASSNETVSLTLPQNAEVAIFGACDNECSDLDLFLMDGGGSMVDQDTETDDIPLVVVQTGSAQSYTLRVGMITCTIEPCYYAVGVYRRN